MSNNQGYVWAPYVMVQNVSVISENEFKPKSAIKSRYSTVMTGTINNNFFTMGESTNNKRKKKLREEEISKTFKIF